MALKETAQTLTAKAPSESPYSLNSQQVLKASQALAKHIESKKGDSTGKKDVLALDADEQADGADQPPIFLLLTAKKHIVDKHRLKPAKIRIPHTLDNNKEAKICIITADPPTSKPKAYKEMIQGPGFPTHLSSRIAKVIPMSRLKAKHKSYESVRQFNAEYDIFLADDRVINLLPQVLGKTFYKSTAKRPVPIVLSGKEKVEKPQVIGGNKKRKVSTDGGPESIATQEDMVREIENALNSTYVHLSQSVHTSIRVARAGWPAGQIAANIEAVANEAIERLIPQKWRNVKTIYIKGHTTAALPVWLADEMWQDEKDVLEDGETIPKYVKPKRTKAGSETKAIESGAVKPAEDKKEKKRKALEEQEFGGFDDADTYSKKAKKEQAVKETVVEKKKSSESRKDKLKQLKAQAAA